nr:hypothetical protein [Tanacetum cinerariifolium]
MNLVEIVNKQVITPATAKAVEKTCVICGGVHAYYDCIPTDSNQLSVCAATGTYNQVSPPNRASHQIPPLGFALVQNNPIGYNQNQGQGNNFNRGNNFQNNQGYRAPMNNAPKFQNQGFQNQPFQVPHNQIQPGIPNENSSYMESNEIMIKSMQNKINVLRGDFNKQEENLRRNLNNDMRSILRSLFQNQASTSGTLSSNTVPNPKGEIKAVTTRSGLAYEGPSIPTNSPLGKPNIPNPSRLNDQKLREKATNQMEKFFQIFHDLHFDISFADTLLLMSASTIKRLLTNKYKLFELAKVSLNEKCLAMLLKKLPEKLGDPDKFFIPCNFLGINVCHALADLGASINLMPLLIWKKISLLELTPTRMTLKLADRSITRPKGVAEDVFVKVGKFHFPNDFVVVDFEADPRVPLILGRSFLRTGHALIDVYGKEITLRVNEESLTFNLNQTMRYSSTYDDNYVNRVDVIDIAYFLNDESIPTGIDNSFYDPEGDILYLEKLLNEDPFQLPLMDLKQAEETKAKSSIEEPPELELKELSSDLEYAFLEDTDKLPVIIAKDLKDVEKEALIKVLKSHKRAIAWKISEIKGHKILKSRIEVDRAKVNFIAKLPHPTTVKDVRSFLGYAGFYRRFIQDFSKIARPMNHLLEKETPFVFSKECVDAFDTLKKKLTEALSKVPVSLLLASLGERPEKAFCCTGFIDQGVKDPHQILAPLAGRSSSRITRDQTSNPTSSTNTTPKGRNRRSSKQKVENSNLEENLPPVVTMVDNRTMAELLRPPTEGYAEAIVVPSILAEQFELKHSLINMMTSDQFFGLEKDNPHDHIRRTTSLRNEISKFQQKFDESFHEAWDRYKDLLRACPHHGFTEFHRLNTFYNALNPTDQDSLNAAAGGNLLERINEQTSVVTTAMTAMLKQFQATHLQLRLKLLRKLVLPAEVLIHITSVLAPMATLSQNSGTISKDTFQQPQSITIRTRIDMVKNELRNEMKTSIQTSLSNQTNEIKNMMASLLQMNTASTSSSGTLPRNTVANPKTNTPFSASKPNPQALILYPSRRNNERNREKTKDQIEKFYQIFKDMSFEISFADALILMPKFASTLKALIGNKEKLSEMARTPLNEHCSTVLLKKLPEKLGDPGKFLILCDFPRMAECLALADLGASINLMPYSVWKRLSLPELTPTCMTLELADR